MVPICYLAAGGLTFWDLLVLPHGTCDTTQPNICMVIKLEERKILLIFVKNFCDVLTLDLFAVANLRVVTRV